MDNYGMGYDINVKCYHFFIDFIMFRALLARYFAYFMRYSSFGDFWIYLFSGRE